MKRQSPLLFLVLAFSSLLFACTDPVDKAEKKAVPAQKRLTVNGQSVERKRLVAALERRIDPVKLKQALKKLDPLGVKGSRLRAELEASFGRLAVNEAWEHCIYEVIADQAIKKAGIKVTDKAVEARLIAEIAIYKKSPAAAWMSYEEHLKSKGSSLQRRREDLKREIGLDKVLGEPTEKSVQDYFKENYDDYSDRKVELYHILFKEKAAALRVLRALERGDDFAVLAKQHSKEPSSAKKGGRVGWVRRRGDIPRELAKAAFELTPKARSIGGPVKTVYGWHLFRIQSERGGKVIPLKDMKPRILLALKKQRRVQFMIAERKRAKVQGDD